MSEPLRQGRVGFRPLVAFDFDGTLTYRDSFPCLSFLARRPLAFLDRPAGLAPSGIAWLAPSRQTAAEGSLGDPLSGKGARRQDVERAARAFASERSAEPYCVPDALRCWRDWRARGARLIIVTASPEIIVAPFAHGLGADSP